MAEEGSLFGLHQVPLSLVDQPSLPNEFLSLFLICPHLLLKKVLDASVGANSAVLYVEGRGEPP